MGVTFVPAGLELLRGPWVGVQGMGERIGRTWVGRSLARETLAVAVSHRLGECLEYGGGFPHRWRRHVFGAFRDCGSVVGDQMDGGFVAGSGEDGVRPLLGELFWAPDDDRGFYGRALAGVAGDRVGVFQVLADAGAIKDPLLAGVGPDHDPVCDEVGDGRGGAVVDVDTAVVASGDHPIPDRPIATTDPHPIIGE